MLWKINVTYQGLNTKNKFYIVYLDELLWPVFFICQKPICLIYLFLRFFRMYLFFFCWHGFIDNNIYFVGSKNWIIVFPSVVHENHSSNVHFKSIISWKSSIWRGIFEKLYFWSFRIMKINPKLVEFHLIKLYSYLLQPSSSYTSTSYHASFFLLILIKSCSFSWKIHFTTFLCTCLSFVGRQIKGINPR